MFLPNLKTFLLKKNLIIIGYQTHILFNCICNAVETWKLVLRTLFVKYTNMFSSKLYQEIEGIM